MPSELAPARARPATKPAEDPSDDTDGTTRPSVIVAVCSAFGAAIGGAFELIAQPLLLFQDGRVDEGASTAGIAIAPLITAAVFGAVGLLAAAPVSRLGGGRRRVLAATFVGLVLATFGVIHALGVAIRYSSGIYPSLSSARFLTESPVQFLDHAAESYPWGLPAVALAWIVGWSSSAAFLAWALRRARPRPLLFAVPAFSFIAVAALCLPSVQGALRAFGVETAETELFAASVEASRTPASPSAGDEGSLDGPPQSEARAFRRALGARGRSDERLPNVVLIMLESVPAAHMGYAGYERPVTPNIDRLAESSLRLHRVWSTSTHSNYAQMAVLSSLFPRRRGGLDTYKRLDYPRALPQDLLRPLGYDTATFSSQNEDWQWMRRFQTTSTPHHFFDTHSYDGPKMGSTPESKVPDDATIDAAIAWLGARRARPFYLYVNLQQTHFSYSLPRGVEPHFEGPSVRELRQSGLSARYMGVERRARDAVRLAYDNALRFADAQVGRLLDALEARGVLDETLVVITADHGESFGEAGIDTHGKTLREPEARPPLLLYFPKRIAAEDRHAPVSHLDVMPSVLDALGLPPYPGYQGMSFLDEEAFVAERRAVFLTMQGLRHADGVVCYPWKLVHDLSARRIQLYHLGRDPRERRNLAEVHPEVREALEALLDRQLHAQLEYHSKPRLDPEERFAPRIARCPELSR